MGAWFMSLTPSLTNCPTSRISALTIELFEIILWFVLKEMSRLSSFFKGAHSWEFQSDICAFLSSLNLGWVFMNLSLQPSCLQLFIWLQPPFIFLYFSNLVSLLSFRLLFDMQSNLLQESSREIIVESFFFLSICFFWYSDHCSAVKKI